MDWKFFLVLIFSLFVAVFTIQNADAVNIQFLTFEFAQVSQALVILISAAAGALIALLFGAIRWVKDKSKLAGSKKTIATLEAQMKQLQLKLDTVVAQIPIQAEGTTESIEQQPDTNEDQENTTPKKKWYQL